MEILSYKKRTTREQIKDIMLDVSWAKVSKKYFNRSPSWIYHKIDGIDGNGRDGNFTAEEKQRFINALYDLSERIKKVADNLD